MNRTLASSVLAASLMAIGCASSSPSTPSAAAPATVPAAPAPATVPPTPPAPTVVTGQATTPPPPAAAAALPPETDMTHSFTKDTPYFADKPTATSTPAGTFKAGTKVIVLIPGAPYAKVQSLEGVVAYASIDNLEPLSSK